MGTENKLKKVKKTLDLYSKKAVYLGMKNKEKRMETKIKHFNPMALREKYSADNLSKRTNPFSSFWADTSWDSRRSEFIDDEPVKKGVDHVQLASYRRAISNFVTIVTGESDINVKFQTRDDSYTDGNTVVIGSKIDEKNFDPVVGLALHEGSHIKLSDFDFLRNLDSNTPEELFILAEKKGFDRFDALNHLKNLLNYVEDRRIDYYVFSTSPGYKGYYHSMYDKYFHSKVVTKALLTNSHTDLDWDSYIMRILNLTNENRRLDVLPGLDKIYKLIFKNIKTMNSTEEAYSVANQVYRIILNNLPDGLPLDEDGNSTSDSNEESNENGMEGSGEGSNGGNEDGEEIGGEVELTPHQERQLSKQIQKQKDFVNGNTKKQGTLTKKDNQVVKTMEEAGVEKINTGEGLGEHWDNKKCQYVPSKGVDCIYVKKLTQGMIDEHMFPTLLSTYNHDRNDDTIARGISLGTKLGKKLQVRGESRDLKWTRLDSGRIDKRLISELGFGNERVFQTTHTESYADAFLHISVDASGSMGGRKWDNTMTSIVAICKAVDMISNVDVVVSFRTTHDTNGRYYGRGSNSLPLILVAYDSRVDKFAKVKRMFKYISPGGTTPEGLCFEAILKDIVPTSNNRDSYFLNFSDGMPMFSNNEINYNYGNAFKHTNKQVKEIRKMGVKVLSYFVADGDYRRDEDASNFKKMYGNDAEYIDVNNVLQVAKTMNKKFLEK